MESDTSNVGQDTAFLYDMTQVSGIPVSSTNKTDRYHITELLLKVAKNQTKPLITL
jgi:hypothetical protein